LRALWRKPLGGRGESGGGGEEGGENSGLHLEFSSFDGKVRMTERERLVSEGTQKAKVVD
jgi:hypothetical protein